MDIIASRQAVEYARKWTVDDKKGPLLLEFVTYRYGGHSSVVVRVKRWILFTEVSQNVRPRNYLPYA